MICSICQRDANDNACAYYNVGKVEEVWKCWFCLAPHEKQQLEIREAIPATKPLRVFTKWKTREILLTK